MAKAVLVMDMPESCSKCKFMYEFQGIKKCQLMNALNNVLRNYHKAHSPRNGMIGVHSGNCRRRWKCAGSTRSRVSLSRRIELVGMLV